MLVLKVIRDIKNSWLSSFSIILIILIGVMYWSGMQNLRLNMSRIVDEYYASQNMADIFVSGYSLTYSDIRDLKRINGVSDITGRTTVDFVVPQLNDAVLRINAVSSDSDICKPLLHSGNYIKKGDGRGILLNKQFYDANGFSEGDTIRLRYINDYHNFIVAGSIQTPENIYTMKDAATLMPNHNEFGYALIDEVAVTDILYNGEHNKYNQLYITVDDEGKIPFIKDELMYKLGTRVQAVMDREDYPSAQMIQNEIDSLKTVVGIIPMLFFVVAALISYTGLRRLVEKERKIIGAMKAMGITKYTIILHYMLYGCIYGLTGSCLGVWLSTFIPGALMTVMTSFFDLPPYVIHYELNIAIIGVAIAFFSCLLSSFLAARNVLKLAPAECMRPKSVKPGKRILLERVEFIWNRLNFIHKVILRNMLRNKDRIVMSIFGICSGTIIVFIAMAMLSSINNLLDTAFDGRNNYDTKIFFKPTVTASQIHRMEILPQFKYAEALMEVPVKLTNAVGITKSASITVVPDDMRLMELYPAQYEGFPASGAILTSTLAKQLDVTEGDSLKLSFTGRRDTLRVVINKIIIQNFGQGMYISKSAWRNLGEQYSATSVLAILEDYDTDMFRKKIEDDYKFVAGVQYEKEIKAEMERSLEMSSVSVSVMIAFATIMALTVLFNLGMLNYFEREREIATLKVLGFYKREMQTLAFAENYIFAVIGIMTGFIFAKPLFFAIIQNAQTDSLYFEPYVTAKQYIITGIIVLFYAWITNKFLSRYIKNTNVIEMLKSIE